MRLTQEQQEMLDDLKAHEGVKAFLISVEDRLYKLESDVISFPLDGSNDHELIQRKCRAEGARKLWNDIKSILNPQPAVIRRKANSSDKKTN